eukprot:PITA_05978
MNFLRRFVPNLAEHLRDIQNMLKKDSQVKWMEEAAKSFNIVKLALSSALVLISPDYTQDFILFSFASDHTMAAVLLHKRDDHERPIAFFSRAIRDATLKYNIIEKQALALVKALKDFQVYILHSRILAYVPNAAVKDVLVQTDPEGRQGKWIAALLEYDLEIKPTKLVKGQGLAKLMAESNLHALDINLIVAMIDENEEGSSIQVFEMFALSPWYSDIIYVLKNVSPPPGMTRNKARTLKLKVPEAKQVMQDFHEGDCGGHLFWKTTANKVLRAGYYWPKLFADVYKVVKSYHKCQIFEGRWILIATDYFTKWIEAIPTRQATDAVIISFLENNILSRFGCLGKLITDNATTFKSRRMVEFFHKYHIILGHSTAYHPQGNGLAESSNKSLVNIIKKLLEINKKSWHKRLVNSLWTDRASHKKSIGMSPFKLVYGVDTVFSTSLAAPVVKLL